MKPALFVIDMQKAFLDLDPATKASLESATEYINEAIRYFRESHLPVMVIQHKNESENLVPGVDAFDVLDTLHLLESDARVVKTYGNAFNQTPLLDLLREQGVDTVIITGFQAEGCVLSTERGARDLDLAPIILRDGIATGSAEHKRFVEEISDLVSYGALKKMLDAFG